MLANGNQCQLGKQFRNCHNGQGVRLPPHHRERWPRYPKGRMGLQRAGQHQIHLCTSGGGPASNGAAFLHLRRICEIHVQKHPEEICPIIFGAIAKVAEYIAEEPRSRSWNIYDLNDFVDLLASDCEEECVLDAVDLLARYRPQVPQISGRRLAALLEKYASAHAQKLREHYRDALVD